MFASRGSTLAGPRHHFLLLPGKAGWKARGLRRRDWPRGAEQRQGSDGDENEKASLELTPGELAQRDRASPSGWALSAYQEFPFGNE